MDPTPTNQLDEQLKKTRRSRERVQGVIITAQACLLILITPLAIVLGFLQLGEHQRVDRYVAQIVSSNCLFYEPFLYVPVPATSSKLAVQLVEGSRLSWLGDSCGTLPPPQPGLKTLGRKYGITITP